jgi:ribosomal protein L40E
MVYSNHFVMCVMVDGKPLKEKADGTVQIPMNSEYAIRFKNKNSRRALVKFTLDGEDASGGGYVIDGHKDIEIRRFSDRDQTFKFVDLNSGEAQLEGKNGPNTDGSKGVIEAKFYLEKEYVAPAPLPVPVPMPYPYPVPMPYPVPRPSPWRRPYEPYYLSDNTRSRKGMVAEPTWSTNSTPTREACGGGGTMSSCSLGMAASSPECTSYNCSDAAPTPTYSMSPPVIEGVTVGGGASGQTFVSVYFNAETDHVTLRLILRGVKEGTVVQEAVEESEYCRNCGAKKPRKNDKFCGKCGSKF